MLEEGKGPAKCDNFRRGEGNLAFVTSHPLFAHKACKKNWDSSCMLKEESLAKTVKIEAKFVNSRVTYLMILHNFFGGGY